VGAAALACKRRRFDDALGALDRAESAFREVDHETGQFLAAWTRAEVALERGEGDAVRRLDDLASRAPEGLKIGLLAARLCAHTTLPDGAGVEELRAEYEAARGKQPSASREMRVYRKLGGLYVRLSDPARAAAAYREALAAAQKLHASFSVAEEQERFARAQAGLLAEAREALLRTEETAEAERLTGSFSAGEDQERRKRAALEKRERGHRRLALGLVLLNLAALAGLIGLVVHADSRATGPALVEVQPGLRLPLRAPATLRDRVMQMPGRADARLGTWSSFLLLSLVIWTALALLYAVLLALAGRLFPALKRRGGMITVNLALFPWLTLAGLVVFRAL
jgi:hypothetical protein